MIHFITKYLEEVGTLLPKQIFRGQADASWPLLPSLARHRETICDGQWTFNSWQEVETTLIDELKRCSVPFLDQSPGTELEWLALAQHYGLPTVLQDWTTNPLKALFFAVENPDHDTVNATVFSYLPASWYNSTEDFIPVTAPTCFFPRHQNARIINQEGCFLIFPLPDGLAPFGELESIHGTSGAETLKPRQINIPAGMKEPIRQQLDMLGITHQTVFPGLEGISKTICRRAGIR